jgi:hypothetical protein
MLYFICHYCCGLLQSAMHHEPQAMLDVWREWPGLTASLPPQALPEASILPSSSSSPPPLPSLQLDEEQRQLELALERSRHER